MDVAKFFRIINTQAVFAPEFLADPSPFELFDRAAALCFSGIHGLRFVPEGDSAFA